MKWLLHRQFETAGPATRGIFFFRRLEAPPRLEPPAIDGSLVDWAGHTVEVKERTPGRKAGDALPGGWLAINLS